MMISETKSILSFPDLIVRQLIRIHYTCFTVFVQFILGPLGRVALSPTAQMIEAEFSSLYASNRLDKLRLQLSISDGLTDEYIDIDQLFSKEEWKSYSDEFRAWNEIFPFQLGDRVRTIKDIKSVAEAGKIGIINEICVSDYLGYSVSYGVACLEEGWNGPFWDGFACDPDEIEIIEKNKQI